MATASSNLTSYDSGYQAYSVSNLDRGCAGSDSTNYAQINLTQGNGGVTQIYYNFSLPTIPSGATNISVSCTCKCQLNTTNASRIATRQIQLYSGTTAMGTAYNPSNTTTAFTISAGTWTAAQLNAGVKLRLYVVRGSSNTTTNYYLRLYGASIEVTYTEPVTGDKVFVKVNGTWKEGDVKVKVNGAWTSISKVSKKVNGAWEQQQDISALFDSHADLIKS